MKIFFAGDHAGFELKKTLMAFVQDLGHTTEDLGPFSYEVTDDYPDFVIPLAMKVASYSPFSKGSTTEMGGISTTPALADSGTPFIKGDKSSIPADLATSFKKGGIEDEVRGIVAAGSGQGEIIALNRIPSARAVVYYGGNPEILKITREHNNSNILAIGTRFVTEAEAKTAVKLWLETPFSGDERHIRRLRKIEQMTDNL